jgi:hypothetical protein
MTGDEAETERALPAPEDEARRRLAAGSGGELP